MARYSSLILLSVLSVMIALSGVEPPARAEQGSGAGRLVKLRMIVLKNREAAQSVLSALDNGVSFIRLAREVSVGPNADRGGHIGTVDINRLKPELREAIKGLKPGQHTGVVETAMGHAIFQVTTDLYYDKGLRLFGQARYREAIQEFKRDLELNPDSAFSYFYLGLSQNKLNRNRQAAASLETAARLDPDLVETYYNLGRVYAALGRTDDAERMYLKAIEMAPDFHLAHNNLAWLYARSGTKIEEGIRHARIAIQLSPSEPVFRHTLADLYLKAGKKDDAIQALKMAVRLAPDAEFYREQLAAFEASQAGETGRLTTSTETPPAVVSRETERAAGFMKLRSSLSQEVTGQGVKEGAARRRGLRIKVLNGNGIKGAATKFAKTLEAMNYPVEAVGNAENFDWERTTLLYRKGKVEEVLALAHKIPGEQDVFRLRGHQPFDLVIILGRE